jgi:hypothetical protein
MAANLSDTVAVILVLALSVTVVCDCVAGFWTSSVSPVILAIDPVAAGAAAAAPPEGAPEGPPPAPEPGVDLGLPVATAVVAVVAAGVEPPPHPAATREMMAKALADKARRPPFLGDNADLFTAAFPPG